MSALRLDTERTVWLATVRPGSDARPHLVPIWFVWVDGAFWLGTGRRSVKVANLEANDRAVVALPDPDAPVVAETTAVLHAPPFPPAVVGAFRDRFGWDITVGDDADVGEIALVELRPTRWVMGGPEP